MRRRPRKFNLPLARGIIMACLSLPVGALSAISGIGSQVALQPLLDFMVGGPAEAGAGTGLLCAVVTAVAALAGLGRSAPPIEIGPTLIVAVSATVGAVIALRSSGAPPTPTRTRWANSLTIILSIVAISEGMQRRAGGPYSLPVDALRSGVGLFAVGALCGYAATAGRLPVAALIVPALVFATARMPLQAVLIALAVGALAGLLPAVGYVVRRTLVPGVTPWMVIGSAAGGWLGGTWLGAASRSNAGLPLVTFAVIAMILSGWSLSRAAQPPD